MKQGFNQFQSYDQGELVSLDALREMALRQVRDVTQKLGQQGVGTSFNRNAKPGDKSSDMGIIGSILTDMVMWSPFMAMVSQSMEPGMLSNAFGAAQVGTFSAVMEGISLVIDEDVRNARINGNRGCSYYHKGRRKARFDLDRLLKKRFNLVAANQNGGFGRNAEDDLVVLFDLLDTIDQMDKKGVRMIRLDTKKPVYDTLKKSVKDMTRKHEVKSFSRPMSRAI